jgi:hypothetical protein
MLLNSANHLCLSVFFVLFIQLQYFCCRPYYSIYMSQPVSVCRQLMFYIFIISSVLFDKLQSANAVVSVNIFY